MVYGKNIYKSGSLKSYIADQYSVEHLVIDARKPVFGVGEEVRLNPACSATETS